jgi:hypothetical protein
VNEYPFCVVIKISCSFEHLTIALAAEDDNLIFIHKLCIAKKEGVFERNY